MEEEVRILLIEDDKIDQMAFERLVERENLPYDHQIAGSVAEAKNVLAAKRFDAALIDYLLGDGTAFDLFDDVGGIPSIVITGSGDEQIAVQAMKAGAYDYLIKDPEGNYLTTLPLTVENAISRWRAEEELERYRERLEELVEGRTAELAAANEQLLAEIAERVRAEESLRESEERFRTIFETVNDIIAYIDPHGKILNINERIEDLLGYARDEIVGKNFTELAVVRPEDLPRIVELFRDTTREGQAVGILELGLRRKDGEIAVMEVGTRFIKKNGEVEGAVCIFRDITERKQAVEELQQSYLKLQRTLAGTVNALVSAIEIKDPYTAGHQRRVTQLACAIANELGLPQDQIEGIRMAGLIHDLGKISIPAEILSKPSRLNKLEWGIIKAHPSVAYEILKDLDFPWPVARIVLQHHERLDGSGYPQGLSGEGILMKARILAVADVVEAMASHRPYRPARGLERALEEIAQHRGILYDYEVVNVCLKLFAEKGFAFE